MTFWKEFGKNIKLGIIEVGTGLHLLHSGGGQGCADEIASAAGPAEEGVRSVVVGRPNR